MHDDKVKSDDEIERHTLTVLVDNEAGVLARVVGLFSGRGYNIESLTVAEVDPMARTSRITIVTSGTPEVIEQIEAQLRRLIPAHAVTNWSSQKTGIEREMALIKVAGTGDKRVEALRMAEAFRARPVDTTHSSFVFEITGAPDKIDSFVDLMRPLGLVDVSRTGVAAISRGPEAM
jgi:acetolactate synthase-1/3 small subunit